MKKIIPYLVLATTLAQPIQALSGTSADKINPAAERGKNFWNQKHSAASAQARSCASCHTANPRQTGKHVRTGKQIKPMAPSVNPSRFSDPEKTAKWFKRNCKWTLGRECTMQEKDDFTRYLKSL